jgi:hypothetical protein
MEETGLENQLLNYNVAEDMHNSYNEFMGYDSHAPRPQDYDNEEGDWSDYDAALAEWYANTPAEALTRDADKQLWATQAYNSGDMTAEQAQEMWDEAFYSRHTGEQSDTLTSNVTASIDENGNVVHSHHEQGDGFHAANTTYDRIEFGVDDSSSYGAYSGNSWQTTEQFDRGFAGGLQKMVQTMASNPAGGLILGVITGGLAGPLTSSLVSAGLSQAVATAASQAIINSAVQLVTTGDLDPMQALISAGGAYLQAGGMESILGSAGGESILNGFNEALDKLGAVGDSLSTGNSLLDSVIKGAGMSAATQLVTTGEISPTQLVAAAAQAGLQSDIKDWAKEQAAAAMNTTTDQLQEDEFAAWLDSDDELQQAFIDADIKDPFLNSNYTTIGDGLMQNAAGEVFNYDGDSVGNMSDLDVDGDGVLNANDLEFVEATGTYRPTGTFSSGVDAIENGKAYYLADDGNVYAVSDYNYAGDDTYKHKETGHVISGIEEGVAVNGQLMVDTNGDGQFNEVWNNKGQRVGVFDPETKQWLNVDGEVSNKIGTYMNEINNVGGGQEYDNPFEYTREEYSLLSGAELMDDMFTNRGSGGMTSMTKVELAAIMQKFDSVEAFEAYAKEQGFGINISGDQVVISTGVDYEGAFSNDGVWNITDGSSVDDIFGGPDDTSGTNVNVTDGPVQPTEENPFEEEVVEETEEEPEDTSDPVDNTDNNLTGGDDGTGDDGNPNENEYVEDTNVNDSTVVDLNNELTNDDSTDDSTSSTNPTDSTDSTDSTNESTETGETEEVVDDNGEVVDSNGEVVTNTGSTSNAGSRTNQLLGLLSGTIASASGQNGDTNSTGTSEEETENEGSGEEETEEEIGNEIGDDSGEDAEEQGPGNDDDGTGDPGIDDGTGGDGDGDGDGSGGGGLLAGGGDFTPKWGSLFKYTDITPAQAKKMAPMYDYIKQTKGMLS